MRIRRYGAEGVGTRFTEGAYSDTVLEGYTCYGAFFTQYTNIISINWFYEDG